MKTAVLPDIADVVGIDPGERGWLDSAEVRGRVSGHLGSGLTRESWKYTPIKGFLEALAEAAAPPAADLTGIDQPGLRAVPLTELDAAGQARIRRMIAHRLEPERHPVTDLALLRALGGWYLEVTGRLERPVEIHYPAGGIVPVFVEIHPNAALCLVEHPGNSAFLAQITHAELGAGARLDHHRAAFTRDVPHYSAVTVRMDRDSGYQLNQNFLGGKRRRAEVHLMMDAPGTHADLAGAYLVEDGQHLDQQLTVEHRAGHTVSRQKFHGIGAGKGRSVFNGRIHIHPGAPQADAALSNKNLALHPDAEMNTKPELEIYTDDVRCAHGATVGQLATDSLFYLTARGIPEDEARRLLSHGFVRECMAGPLAQAAADRFREAM